ncbi:MAG: type II toxin-antitoxin system HipA family toxin [Marinilabiliaceae bacterium]|jgi:serine/threonine-protein kinase HipA|nr:type II toxin-antitoxin system HipA family toxin [Marinilabiliaceae bacterium]
MTPLNKLNISIELEGDHYQAGELVLASNKIYFRYNSQFLNTGLNLSPLKLAFNNEIQSATSEPFEGLFGLFNDSLPDSWGRLLMDRELRSRNIDLTQITPLDRLAYVGSGGMGALVYTPDFKRKISKMGSIDLDKTEDEIKNVLKGDPSDILEELYALGGSSGGTRPKIFVAFDPGNKELIYGPDTPGNNYENWIIKFPATVDSPEIAKIEYAYHIMAIAAGIEMSECRLFEGNSGNLFFGTLRFDRDAEKRYHVHTASGLIHDNFKSSNMDYGHLMDCAFRLEKHVKAYEKVFRLAAFNVFAHNRDDHSKNFSFLMNRKGQWKFAPAYDLTFSYSAFGFHSTMIAGESKEPGKDDLLRLAKHFGLRDPERIIEEVRSAISKWETIALDLDISKRTISEIASKINCKL